MKSKNRSMLGVTAAVLLALVGGLLLWQNSDSGESEAVEPAVEETQVVVAKRDIQAGESASEMSDNAFAFVELVSVPLDEVKFGALTSVTNLSDLAIGRNVVVASIPSGAQLTTADFVVAGQQELSALPDVDPNLFELTVALEPQRALGGNLRPGMNVAIVGSFDTGPDVVNREPTTVVVTESTLVTDIKTEQLFSQEQLSNDPLAPSLAPTSRLFVTFGVTVEDLEKITYAVEFGRVWLSRQHDDATVEGSELTVINNEAVSLDPKAPSNDLLTDPFNPDPVLALVDEGSEDDGEG
ncbi:MAG: hypothetical protein ACR2PK_07850 [Acidimicrobiales bacterium]